MTNTPLQSWLTRKFPGNVVVLAFRVCGVTQLHCRWLVGRHWNPQVSGVDDVDSLASGYVHVPLKHFVAVACVNRVVASLNWVTFSDGSDKCINEDLFGFGRNLVILKKIVHFFLLVKSWQFILINLHWSPCSTHEVLVGVKLPQNFPWLV